MHLLLLQNFTNNAELDRQVRNLKRLSTIFAPRNNNAISKNGLSVLLTAVKTSFLVDLAHLLKYDEEQCKTTFETIKAGTPTERVPALMSVMHSFLSPNKEIFVTGVHFGLDTLLLMYTILTVSDSTHSVKHEDLNFCQLYGGYKDEKGCIRDRYFDMRGTNLNATPYEKTLEIHNRRLHDSFRMLGAFIKKNVITDEGDTGQQAHDQLDRIISVSENAGSAIYVTSVKDLAVRDWCDPKYEYVPQVAAKPPATPPATTRTKARKKATPKGSRASRKNATGSRGSRGSSRVSQKAASKPQKNGSEVPPEVAKFLKDNPDLVLGKRKASSPSSSGPAKKSKPGEGNGNAEKIVDRTPEDQKVTARTSNRSEDKEKKEAAKPEGEEDEKEEEQNGSNDGNLEEEGHDEEDEEDEEDDDSDDSDFGNH